MGMVSCCSEAVRRESHYRTMCLEGMVYPGEIFSNANLVKASSKYLAISTACQLDEDLSPVRAWLMIKSLLKNPARATMGQLPT